jgi:hypothetical protein
MRDLNDKGYLQYEPSFNPYKGSMVFLFDFSEGLKPVQKKAGTTEKNLSKMEQVVNQQRTSIDTGTGTSIEQALVSSINYTNITNQSNLSKVANLGESNQNFQNETISPEEKKKEKKLREKKKNTSIPTHEEVQSYFLDQRFPELEAQKFFNYFSSIGWLVGGKSPMQNWRAAAENWMLNAANFIAKKNQTNRAKRLNTETDKDYSEPL